MDRNTKRKIESISSEILNGQNYSRNDFARSILNYPAMMVPSVQEPIIGKLSEELNTEVSLLDPFMGAANTLVTGMKLGLNVFGQDINPLSVLVSQVKTSFYKEEELVDAEKRIRSRLNADNSNCVETNFSSIDKWFNKSIQIELSRICRAICREDDLKTRKFFWVALAETIRQTSNDRTSTFKLHIRTKEEIVTRNISAIKVFLNISKKNIHNICSYTSLLVDNGYILNNEYVKSAKVVWGDTKSEVKTRNTFNLLVTSPPYGDNQTTVTYGQFSFLPLQWIPPEEIDPLIKIDYLKTTQAIDYESLGGKMKENIRDVEDRIFNKSNTLKMFVAQFKGAERKRAEKVTRFINDLDISIDRIDSKMSKISFLVWTIGNRNVNNHVLRNDLILNELFMAKRISLFAVLERDILNKRMPNRNNFSNMMSKEKILIFKKSN